MIEAVAEAAELASVGFGAAAAAVVAAAEAVAAAAAAFAAAAWVQAVVALAAGAGQADRTGSLEELAEKLHSSPPLGPAVKTSKRDRIN